MDVKRHEAYQKAPLKSRRQSPTKWNTLPISGGRAFECAPSGKRRRARTNKNFFAVQSGREANGNFEYPTPFPAPRHCARALPGGVAMRARCHAPRPCSVVRSRRGRARCPHRPWRLATRAAAPPARCAAWHPAPLPERRGLPDAAPCAAIGGARRRPSKTLSVCYLPLPVAHYPGGAMGTSRPTAITHARIARGGSPLRGGFVDNAQKVACTKDSTGIPPEPDVARPAYTTAARPMLPGNRRARTRRLSAISS